jgi:hypothetical protein
MQGRSMTFGLPRSRKPRTPRSCLGFLVLSRPLLTHNVEISYGQIVAENMAVRVVPYHNTFMLTKAYGVALA